MSLFSALVGGPIERKTVDASALTWTALGYGPSKAGVTVNVDTALRVSAVFACVRVLAEGIAQIPKKLMRDKGDRKEPAKEHSLYGVLARRPNSWMTSFELFETMMIHALLAEAGTCIKSMSSDGRVLELLPLVPGRCAPRQAADFSVMYDVTLSNGKVMSFPPALVLRVRGPSWNGYAGLDAIRMARDVIGLAIALEEGHSRLHANGARLGGILTKDGTLKKETRDILKAEFADEYGGVSKTGKVAVLDDGLKFQAMSMTGVDAQHIETRKLQIEEICRMFMVHPQMVFHSDKTSTHASAEQFSLDFVKYGLGPWIKRWEEAIDRDLLTADEVAQGYYAHFEVKGLLRGDHKALGDYYKASLGTASSPGWNSPNDIRRLEDENPIDDENADRIITVADLSGKAPPDEGGKNEAA